MTMPLRANPHLLLRRAKCATERYLVRWTLRIAIVMLSSPGFAGETGSSDPLEMIIARGKIIVGVKKDVPLWGYQNPESGEITGMEVDLARALAKHLGVAAELVGLRSVERIDALQTGRVDLLIATLSDSPERREQITMILPHYYASGVNLLAPRSEKFKDWKELRNRRICGRRGSFYNRALTVSHGADIVAFHSLDWALHAVREGRCSALVYDDTAIVALLRQPEWGKLFEMPMPTLYKVPWALAIDKKQKGSALERVISSAIIEWHRHGVLVDLEKSWGLPATAFLRDMHSAWNRKTATGGWYCGEAIAETTPSECR